MKNVKQGTAHFLESSYFKDYIKTGYVKQGSPVPCPYLAKLLIEVSNVDRIWVPTVDDQPIIVSDVENAFNRLDT